MPDETPDETPGEPLIRLDQFLKFTGLAATGGMAKMLIQDGQVRVNGAVETRRRRKLRVGDVVELQGRRQPVTDPHSA